MPAEISYLPQPRQFSARLLLVIAIAIVAFILLPFIRYQFDGGMPTLRGIIQCDLKALGDFNLDPLRGTTEDIPKQFRDLDGKKVALEGFMYTGATSADKDSAFQFVYNISGNSHRPPMAQERIFVYAPKGIEVPYYGYDECRIFGTLHVKIQNDDNGKISSVYTMDLDRAEPL